MAAARKPKSYNRIVELIDKIMKFAQTSIVINVGVEIEDEGEYQ